MSPNAIAFLAMIRSSEGTAKFPNPWSVTFGERFTISDFSDHPHALGWPGYPYRGIMETAAGAYQINYPTWVDGQKVLNLPDFTRASQDTFAYSYLVQRAGAIPAVEAGQLDAAIQKCAGTWASLPSSTSGQPQAQLADLTQIYATAGGSFA
jgi:muramidase (phage lysozyme)